MSIALQILTHCYLLLKNMRKAESMINLSNLYTVNHTSYQEIVVKLIK
jgi:hypothetical protein